ncbi:hypothetical protein [Sphingobium sp. HDIP04]|uniref:hypothetical protein n=1 Tax=Sphingobium sp. HDIP04 TaxID=428994 RepID=UPI0030832F30
MSLTTQLAIATATVAATVMIHLTGLAGLLAILRRHRHASQLLIAFFVNGMAILLAAFGLFALPCRGNLALGGSLPAIGRLS